METSNSPCNDYLSMKSTILQRGIIVSITIGFLCCYLEWGKDQSEFIGKMEYDLILGNKLTSSIMHPLIFLPLAGQLLLLFTAFQKKPNTRLVLAGIVFVGILVILILLSGILSGNPKIIASTIPFLTASIWFTLSTRKKVEP